MHIACLRLLLQLRVPLFCVQLLRCHNVNDMFCVNAGACGRGLVPRVRQAAGAGRSLRGCTESKLLGMHIAQSMTDVKAAIPCTQNASEKLVLSYAMAIVRAPSSSSG